MEDQKQVFVESLKKDNIKYRRIAYIKEDKNYIYYRMEDPLFGFLIKFSSIDIDNLFKKSEIIYVGITIKLSYSEINFILENLYFVNIVNQVLSKDFLYFCYTDGCFLLKINPNSAKLICPVLKDFLFNIIKYLHKTYKYYKSICSNFEEGGIFSLEEIDGLIFSFLEKSPFSRILEYEEKIELFSSKKINEEININLKDRINNKVKLFLLSKKIK